LKRAHAALPVEGPADISLGRLRIEQANRRVTVNGAEVHLTPIEFNLLAKLAQHHDQVMTHEQLLTSVWGSGIPSRCRVFARLYLYAAKKNRNRSGAPGSHTPLPGNWLFTDHPEGRITGCSLSGAIKIRALRRLLFLFSFTYSSRAGYFPFPILCVKPATL